MRIKDYGWNEHFKREWNKKCKGDMFPARITADYGQMLRVTADSGELLVNRPVQKFDPEMQVTVGDWVAVECAAEINEAARICFVLTRKTKFSRAAAGVEVKEQIVAANVDTVLHGRNIAKHRVK